MNMQASQGNSITNEYAQLLQYLEKNKPKVSTQERQKEQKEVNSLDKIKTKTNKLLEECKVPQKTKRPKPITEKKVGSDNTGFDVSKFEGLMRSKLIDQYKKLQSYDRPYISVTETIACIRRSFYQRQKYPIDVKSQYKFAYVSLITNIGDAVHSFIQNLYDFEELEKTIISEKYQVKGRIDGLRGNFLIEIKTIDEDKFKNTFVKRDYHQGLVYAYILNNEYNYSINTITIVYVLRNLKKIFPYDLPYKPSVAESFLNNALILKQSLVSKNVPEPVNSTIEQCRFCPYIKFCSKDGTSKIKLPFDKSDKDELEKSNMNNSIFLI